MQKTMLITTTAAPSVAALSAALMKPLASAPVISPPGRALDRFRPDVVHALSMDDVTEADVDKAIAAGARIVADVHDLGCCCTRGRMLKCDRTFCSRAEKYPEARCFAYDFDVAAKAAPGEVFEAIIPEGKNERSALLATCGIRSREDFEKAYGRGVVSEMTKVRRDLARLVSKIDLFLCANKVVERGLKDFGLGEKNLYADETMFALASPASAEMVERRAEVIARAGKYALEMPHPAKWRAERENTLLMMQDLFMKRLAWESRPSHIEMATNNVCNLHCLMCDPGARKSGESLSEKEIEDICEALFPAASLLTPSSTGVEPLLGNLELVARMCDKYEVELNLITNGTLLTPERYELVRRRLGRLQISFDSCDREAYEKIRVGAKFDAVVENIRTAAKLTAADNIELMTSIVVMKPNYKRLAEYVEFVAGLGVPTVALQELLVNFKAVRALRVTGVVPEAEIRAEIDRAIEAARRCKVNLHVGVGVPRVYRFGKQGFRLFKLDYMPELVVRRYPNFCWQTATYLKVDADGSVYPCCREPAELNMGNLRKQSFEEIWNGKKYRQLRREMFTGKYSKCCRACSMLTMYAAAEAQKEPS